MTTECEIEPYVLELPDGRALHFYNYDFTPGYAGSWAHPPESNEVNVDQAWWADGSDFGEELTEDELTWLHEDDAAYGALLILCEGIEGDRLRAQLSAEGCEE